MVVFRSTWTTEQLEKLAARGGWTVGIVRSDENCAGRYFVVSVNNKPLRTWYSLGWTGEEAKCWVHNNFCCDGSMELQCLLGELLR